MLTSTLFSNTIVNNGNISRSSSELFTKASLVALVESLAQGYDPAQGPIGLVECDQENDPRIWDAVCTLFLNKDGEASGSTVFDICGQEHKVTNDVVRSKIQSWAADLPDDATLRVVYGNRRCVAAGVLNALFGIDLDLPTVEVAEDEADRANIRENVSKLLQKAITSHDRWGVTQYLSDNGQVTKEGDLPFGRGVQQQQYRMLRLATKYPELSERFSDTSIRHPGKEVAKQALDATSFDDALAILTTGKEPAAVSKTIIREICKDLSYGDDDVIAVLEGIASGNAGRFRNGMIALADRLGLRG